MPHQHVSAADLGAPAEQMNFDFTDKMVRRMATSYHKYGPMRKARDAGVLIMAAAEQRLALYRETGNTEYLVDAANFLMMEYTTPAHPKAHFEATDSDGSPGVPFKPDHEYDLFGNPNTPVQLHGRHSP